MIYICEWCNKIKEVPDPPRPERDSRLNVVDMFDRTPHYICADCYRKLWRESDEEAAE